MEEAESRDWVSLIRAYEPVMKKDLKECLAFVDRTVSAGYPKEEGMILNAAYLNKTGLPKRTVGICENFSNKRISSGKILFRSLQQPADS